MNCSTFTVEQCQEIAAKFASSDIWTFNPEAADIALYGMLKMWVAGLGVGLIISIIKKLRR